MRRSDLAVLTLAGLLSTAAQADTVTVYAAGSLRRAFTTIAADFERATPGPQRKVQFVFGASGLLLERLRDKNERADVFASANMAHPQALAAAGRAKPVQAFARNALCALHAATLDLSADNLVDRLLDARIKLGTSTPKADPSGDYAFAMFERIGQQRRGAGEVLAAKALQLTGGPTSPAPPADRNVYGMLVASGQADVFITYCTNATLAIAEQPALRMLRVPEAYNVAASYGVTALSGASPAADAFVAHLLGPAGQAVLAKEGFAAP